MNNDRVSAALALAAFLLLLILIRHFTVPKRIPGIPYNRLSYLLPFGDMLSLAFFFNFGPGEVFRWFNVQSLHHQSGIYQVFLASFSTASPVVVVTDPATVKTILTRQAGVVDRASLMALLFSLVAPKASVGKPSGDDFKAQRYLWNGMLGPEFLDTVVGPRSWDAVVKLVELWSLQRTGHGRPAPFEALQSLKSTFFEATVAIVLGRDLGLLDSEIAFRRDQNTAVGQSARRRRPAFARHWGVVHECAEWVVTGIAPATYAWIFTHLFRPFITAQKHIETRLQAIIDEERDRATTSTTSHNQSPPNSALQSVFRRAATSSSRTNQATTPSVLQSELFELLITGHDTTSAAMGWAVKYLADHPSTQETLYRTLQQSFSSSSTPTSREIAAARLPYLDAFLAELLRVACVGPISFREVTGGAGCTLGGGGGCWVPAGTPVVLMTQDVTLQGMLTTVTGGGAAGASNNIEKSRTGGGGGAAAASLSCFCPERWLDEKSGSYNPEALDSIPFSTGARSCFAKKIALLELRIAVTVLVWNYRFEKLQARFSGYTATDRLTRRPTCCYVMPVPRMSAMAVPEEAKPVRLPPLDTVEKF